ncbi:MAG: peptidoglycan-binding protein [Candidatus Sungbacteria bacterium]|uniref:Peptidoglycan-binding protein n=1 Tax=Candidatus Sungiibacteriota bacterium TaxID=2750080 RepID=A0A9D6DQG7_9BACT|nr:peptidoglycan-binding protein [Candidatus Sungbacteria bacterium]
MKKSVIIPLLVSLTLALSAQAQTSSAPTVEELQKQIQLLLSQMGSLQKEITALKSTPTVPVTPTITPSPIISVPAVLPTDIDESEVTGTETDFIPPPILTRSLFRGSRGEDVRQLQEFLAQDSTIYPEGIITGYYGIGTEAAIKRWQAKNGIPAVGVVGRQTIAKFKTFVATYSPIQPTKREVTPPISKPEPDKIAACPALATVDICPAGEERIVTYKSAQCGVYYACKPRENTRTDNTNANLKKISSIQTDNRFAVNLYDPEGIQKFTIYGSKGTEIHQGYPACRKEWTSPTFSADSAEFPLKLSLNDCASSQYTTTLSTSVVVKPLSEGLTFPYTFTNGKVVSSSNEARSYCYANGPGSGQSVAAECETKFGVVYTSVTTTTSGRAIYSTDVFASCMTRSGFSAEAKQIKTWAQSPDPIPWSALTSSAQNTVQSCEREYYGQGTVETGAAMCADGKDNDGDGFIDAADSSCGSDYVVTPPSGQKEQVWNSLGLKSWVKADADSARIAQLKSTCASVPYSSNIWTANAGNYSSADFGMPDSAKCQKASSCTASQYFDGTACVSTTQTTTTTGSCSQYGSGWHTMGSDGNCFDTNMTNYRTANGALYSCTATPTTGCSGTTTTTTTSSTCDSSLTALLGAGCHYMYNDSSGNQTFCDNNMTKSAKRGDTTTTAGCSGSSTTNSWPSDQPQFCLQPLGSTKQTLLPIKCRNKMRL